MSKKIIGDGFCTYICEREPYNLQKGDTLCEWPQWITQSTNVSDFSVINIF